MRCGERVAPDGTKYFMPGCVGGAAMGDAYCTCGTQQAMKQRKDEHEARLQRIEDRLTALEKSAMQRR